MIFSEAPLGGAYVIEIEKREDDRGFFGRAFCKEEFAERGLASDFVQCNISRNKRRGTLRGMHYQAPPHREVKVVRCTKGSIYDVIIDLRSDSPTFKQWFGVELTSENYKMLYVPEDFAHGFQTLVDDAEVFYHVSEFYAPQAERGVRWDDPAFAVDWPTAETRLISPKDAQWPDYAP